MAPGPQGLNSSRLKAQSHACLHVSFPQTGLCGLHLTIPISKNLLDFCEKFCIIRLHGGNAMGQVQPDGPIDDYFPDYQFGCGRSYSSMAVVHRKAVLAAFFVASLIGGVSPCLFILITPSVI
jgi:hypothetical protein